MKRLFVYPLTLSLLLPSLIAPVFTAAYKLDGTFVMSISAPDPINSEKSQTVKFRRIGR